MTNAEIAAKGAELEHASADECRAFWGANRRKRGKALQTLAAYAMASCCAKGLRLEGEIARAMVYEQHCEIYYRSLPEDARW